MLYRLLKIPAQIALPFYCRKIIINKKEYLSSPGPLIIACNHPNSFLDAIILATLFKHPVFSLARGDAFHARWSAFLLNELHILPVYRQREGTEHLHKNYGTFDACQKIFTQKGIVLIFCEALCENEWHLRPVKKGTARLAVAAWQQGIPVKLLPVAINYSSFKLFGKNVHINFGTAIEKPEDIAVSETAKLYTSITDKIEKQLQGLLYEIDKNDRQTQAATFTIAISHLRKMALTIPALVAIPTHAALYIPVQKLVAAKSLHSVHYDSIMVAMLFICYPLYIIVCGLLTYWWVGGYWWLAVVAGFPFCAWSYIQLKKQTN